MSIESKDHLADLIQNATAETVQHLMCPICTGSLNIQYTSRGKGALSIMCAQCMWRVIRDGILREPPWVRQVGPKILTMNKPASS